MAKENNKSNTLSQIIVAVVIALLVGGTSPWWWIELFGENVKPREKYKKTLPEMEIKKYLMDRNPDRIVIVTHLEPNKYRIEEPSGSVPWEGLATIDGGYLIGDARFTNSLATMKVEGVVRGDESILIEYKFITKADGKSAAGKVDNHVWYPLK